MEDAERYTISNAGVDQLWEFRVKSKNAQGNGPECLIQRARTAKKGTGTTDVKIQPRYLTDCNTELITKTRERAALNIRFFSIFVAPQSAPQSLRYKDLGADFVVLEWTTGDTSGIEGYQVIYEDFEQETVAIYI